MEAAVVVGAIGLVTTMLAPILQTRFTARDQKAAWRRDLQVKVYTEAMAHVESLESMLSRVTDPFRTSKDKPDLTHDDVITARLRLVAPDDVLQTWLRLRDVEEAFSWNLSEQFPALGFDYGEAVPGDHEDVVRLRSAIADFRALLRTAFDR